jgi:hypothetical protein
LHHLRPVRIRREADQNRERPMTIYANRLVSAAFAAFISTVLFSAVLI